MESGVTVAVAAAATVAGEAAVETLGSEVASAGGITLATSAALLSKKKEVKQSTCSCVCVCVCV